MSPKSIACRLSLTASLVLGVAASALAAPTTYRIDPSHSAASFSYQHVGLSTQVGRFDTLAGTIELDPEARSGKVDVTVDTASVNTGTAALDQHLKGADFFEIERFPSATFVSDKVNFEGDRPASVEGELTIKGVTRPAVLTIEEFAQLDAHPMAKKPALGATAATTFKRSDFGLGKFAPMNSDEVTLRVVLEAVQP